MANEYVSSTATGSTANTGGTTDGLKAKAQEALGKVQDRAGDRIETTIDEKKGRAADTLNDVAQSLLSSSQSMRAQGNAEASRYIEKAADQVERLASYLDRADVHQVFDEVEGFARRQPAAFMAGAFAVGFLASRFLKSSRGDMGTNMNYRSESGRSSINTGASGIGSYGTTGPSASTWRTGGYSAEHNTTNRDIVSDPARSADIADTGYGDGGTNRGV